MQELSRLHRVAQSHVQVSFNVLVDLLKEIIETIGDRFQLSCLGSQPQNCAVANQKLVADLVLSKRNVRHLNALVERVKRARTSPRSPKGMPGRRQGSAANVKGAVVEDKAVRVTEKANEFEWKLVQ